jgi:hypothetical protein
VAGTRDSSMAAGTVQVMKKRGKDSAKNADTSIDTQAGTAPQDAAQPDPTSAQTPQISDERPTVEPSSGEVDNSNDESDASGVTRPVRIAVAAVSAVVLIAAAGLGVALIGGSSDTTNPKPDIVTAVPVPETEGIGESQRIRSDDALRDWNIQAAAYISPLISQLARAPRTTLGGQIALCKEQRMTLQPVLDFDTPPNSAVSPSFNRWRDAVREALDSCVERTPSGDDAADIKQITREVADTEALFATFLRAQLPFVDVGFEANPDAFERP